MRIIKILTVVLATAALAGCQEDLVPGYFGDTNIYFSFADLPIEWNTNPDSTRVYFGFDKTPKTDTVIYIPVTLQGDMVNYDRPFEYKLLGAEDGTTCTEDEIDIMPSFLPANSNVGLLAVKIKKTERVGKFNLRAVLQLIPNEHFRTDYQFTKSEKYNELKMDARRFKVLFNYDPEMPMLWALREDELSLYFGRFSLKKLDVICEACSFTREFFEYDLQREDPNRIYSQRFGISNLILYCKLTNQYLSHYLVENGKRLLDEDGSIMLLGSKGITMQ